MKNNLKQLRCKGLALHMAPMYVGDIKKTVTENIIITDPSGGDFEPRLHRDLTKSKVIVGGVAFGNGLIRSKGAATVLGLSTLAKEKGAIHIDPKGDFCKEFFRNQRKEEK